MTKNHPESPLEDLGSRLKKARQTQSGPLHKGPESQGEMTGFGQALRIGAELISALIVGTGLGWFLDAWLGTRPWLMIVFIFLGGAAGIINVYRSAMRMADEAREGAPGKPDVDKS